MTHTARTRRLFPPTRENACQTRGVLKNRYGPLLTLVIASIVAQSLIDMESSLVGSTVVHFLSGAALLLAVRAANVSPRWIRAADRLVLGLLVLSVLPFLLAAISGDPPTRGAELLWLAAVALVPVALANELLRSPVVTMQTMMGSVAAYLQIGVAYAFVYQAIDVLGSSPVFGNDVPTTSYMYFSLSTISTLGYGDLLAATEAGRLAAVSEAIFGQVFLVTLVALLVSRFAGTIPTTEGGDEPGK